MLQVLPFARRTAAGAGPPLNTTAVYETLARYSRAWLCGAIAVVTNLIRHPRRYARRALVAVALLSVAPLARAEEATWQFALTPYLWLPHIGTTLSFETPGTGGEPVGMQNLLQYLHAAFFLNGEARKGDWSLVLDFVYCDFEKASSKVSSVIVPGGVVDVPLNSDTTTGLSGSMLSLVGGYSLLRRADAALDVIGGFRYTQIGTVLDWSFQAPVAGLPGRAGSAESTVGLWDGVVGVRGNVVFGGGKWFAPAYLDAGTGTSRFTWQAVIGVGYAFGWGDLRLVYRYLSFEQNDARLIQHLYLEGPALGATFHF